MGKKARHKKPGFCLGNPSPGGLQNILNAFNRWYPAKRRSSHKRHGHRHGSKNDGSDSDSGVANSPVEERAPHSTHATKDSVRGQLKARSSGEFSKGKGKHHRTSTCPVQLFLTRTNSIHRYEPLDQGSFFNIIVNDVSPSTVFHKNGGSSTRSLHKASKSCEELTFGHHDDLTGNGIGRCLAGEHGKQLIRSSTSIQGKSENMTNASLNVSKGFSNALGSSDMKKELYAKIFHDPSSPLSHHFRKQQDRDAKRTLSKSGSFPLPVLPDRKDAGKSKLKQNQEQNRPSAEEYQNEQGSSQQMFTTAKPTEDCRNLSSSTTNHMFDKMKVNNQAVDETTNNHSSDPLHLLKKQGHSQIVKKRFKDLKQKLKDVIKDSRKEKQRISMDAVLHKIPPGKMFSGEARGSIQERLKNTAISTAVKESSGSSHMDNNYFTSLRKIGQPCFARTASLSESVDRYRQLYESSFNKESKHPVDRLKLEKEEADSKKKLFNRILSLPNLRNYTYYSEDSSSAFKQPKNMADHSYEMKSLELYGVSEDSLPIGSSVKSENNSSIGTELQDLVEDTGEISVVTDHAGQSARIDKVPDDMEGLSAEEKTYHQGDGVGESRIAMTERMADSDVHIDVTRTAKFITLEESKPTRVLPEGSEYFASLQVESGMVPPVMADSRVDVGKKEAFSGEELNDMLRLLVDAKDKANFDYVKDVLELSGFSRNEFLGTWHSENQPVDPSVFEELETCLFHNSEGYCDEEGGSCNRLLLFDVINQFLLEIYERSYCYCPVSLSPFSHIRPMPLGHHVLQEVWDLVSWYLGYGSDSSQLLDHVAIRDMAKNDGWMNLQYDMECVGLELEDWIFDDLLDELIPT